MRMHHHHDHHDHHGHQHDHHGRGPHGDRGPGGPGGRTNLGRFFAHGDLRLVILNLIAEKPRHGYEIIKAIEEAVGGAYSPSPGVIYPTLTLLEELGYVTALAAEGGKKQYQITDAGMAALAEKSAVIDGIFKRMEAVNERFEGPAPRIARAMQNLGSAIRVRMSSGPVSASQLDALVAAIDDAARIVEKA